MPKLGDYLGLILAEFTRARVAADVESVRIAKLYAADPMLRTMPIPHFRLPNIELDIPVVISEMDDVGADEPAPTVSNLPAMRRSFDMVLSKKLKKDKIKLTPANEKKLKEVIDAEIKKMEQPVDVYVDISLIAEKLSKITADSIKKHGRHRGSEDTRNKKFNAELKELTMFEFRKFYKPLPRLHILIKTAEIREAGPSENITRIHMKISEEGFELIKEETEDESYDRLVPE